LIEAAISEFLGIDQVELEVSNVFDGRKVQWFLNKVGKSLGVVGVGIDGSGCEVSDSHIFGESNGKVAGPLFMRRHRVIPRVAKKLASSQSASGQVQQPVKSEEGKAQVLQSF
jgi:hypothetical protein